MITQNGDGLGDVRNKLKNFNAAALEDGGRDDEINLHFPAPPSRKLSTTSSVELAAKAHVVFGPAGPRPGGKKITSISTSGRRGRSYRKEEEERSTAALCEEQPQEEAPAQVDVAVRASSPARAVDEDALSHDGTSFLEDFLNFSKDDSTSSFIAEQQDQQPDDFILMNRDHLLRDEEEVQKFSPDYVLDDRENKRQRRAKPKSNSISEQLLQQHNWRGTDTSSSRAELTTMGTARTSDCNMLAQRWISDRDQEEDSTLLRKSQSCPLSTQLSPVRGVEVHRRSAGDEVLPVAQEQSSFPLHEGGREGPLHDENSCTDQLPDDHQRLLANQEVVLEPPAHCDLQDHLVEQTQRKMIASDEFEPSRRTQGPQHGVVDNFGSASIPSAPGSVIAAPAEVASCRNQPQRPRASTSDEGACSNVVLQPPGVSPGTTPPMSPSRQKWLQNQKQNASSRSHDTEDLLVPNAANARGKNYVEKQARRSFISNKREHQLPEKTRIMRRSTSSAFSSSTRNRKRLRSSSTEAPFGRSFEDPIALLARPGPFDEWKTNGNQEDGHGANSLVDIYDDLALDVFSQEDAGEMMLTSGAGTTTNASTVMSISRRVFDEEENWMQTGLVPRLPDRYQYFKDLERCRTTVQYSHVLAPLTLLVYFAGAAYFYWCAMAAKGVEVDGGAGGLHGGEAKNANTMLEVLPGNQSAWESNEDSTSFYHFPSSSNSNSGEHHEDPFPFYAMIQNVQEYYTWGGAGGGRQVTPSAQMSGLDETNWFSAPWHWLRVFLSGIIFNKKFLSASSVVVWLLVSIVLHLRATEIRVLPEKI
ncbi:unnamed protein product [Amoebophrya sp. A120]|nr:unnamed protein product [Amoebophrya sp. A120]|eukprot:GSA120T00018329001.1